MDPLRLYDYVASGNCYKVRLLLHQLALPYERVPIDIFAGDTLTDDYYAKNPERSTPVLQVGGSTYLVESNAILWYLAEGTPLLPGTPLLRAQVVRWLLVEQTEVMPFIGGLRFRLVTGRFRADDPDALRRRAAGEELLRVMDEHLRAHEFLVDGGYTIADVAAYAYTHVAEEAGYELAPYEAVEAWLRRVEGRARFMDDLEPYPANAGPGAGGSIYD